MDATVVLKTVAKRLEAAGIDSALLESRILI
jgi:hypothetical protein